VVLQIHSGAAEPLGLAGDVGGWYLVATCGNLKIGFMAWLVVWNHPYIGMVDGKW